MHQHSQLWLIFQQPDLYCLYRLWICLWGSLSEFQVQLELALRVKKTCQLVRLQQLPYLFSSCMYLRLLDKAWARGRSSNGRMIQRCSQGSWQGGRKRWIERPFHSCSAVRTYHGDDAVGLQVGTSGRKCRPNAWCRRQSMSWFACWRCTPGLPCFRLRLSNVGVIFAAATRRLLHGSMGDHQEGNWRTLRRRSHEHLWQSSPLIQMWVSICSRLASHTPWMRRVLPAFAGQVPACSLVAAIDVQTGGGWSILSSASSSTFASLFAFAYFQR